MKRTRDRSFLDIAVFAGLGGLLAIGFSAGMPIYEWAHHRPATPAFFFFGIWGFVALLGCAASVHTYFVSGDPPDKPPKGGIRQRAFSLVEGGGRVAPPASSDEGRRAA